jgi:putative molybdopterin biosynthesis protein
MLVHGVTMMPGKPVILGGIVSNKPVFRHARLSRVHHHGRRAVRAAPDRACWAVPTIPRQAVAVVPTRKIASKLGVEEFVRVKIGQVGDRIVATAAAPGRRHDHQHHRGRRHHPHPPPVRGHPGERSGAGRTAQAPGGHRNTIVIVGSHDNTLDVLADQLRAGDGALTLSSSHVGSMGGLMAVKRGGCHLAGTHLLDEQTGQYNVSSYVKRYLPDTPVRLVHLVMRDQGLIVPAGNPKGIQGIEDLARDDVRLINRQGGSGTRILLDYRLKQLGLAPDDIAGYDNEEFTHMAVAAAVVSGAADVGLGIHAAARALGLAFIPVVTEQYDLLMTRSHFDAPLSRPCWG